MTAKKIAILGGTGKEGKGLGYKWALAGHEVMIGSRQAEKAELAAQDLRNMNEHITAVSGMENFSAAQWAEVIVLSVPYAGHAALCEMIKDVVQGKLVIDVTVPLVPPKVAKVQMPAAGSATMEAHLILGDEVRIGAAFQNISYENLLGEGEVNCDVLVTGESKLTRDEIIQLVEDAGLRGLDAGPLENSMVVEGLTSVLIGINKKHGIHNAGIRITGID